MAGKKAAPAANEEFVEETDSESWEDDGAEIDPKTGLKVGMRLRDWRDVEKFREMRELRRLVDDDFGIGDVLGAGEPRNPSSRTPASRAATRPAKPKPKSKPKAQVKARKAR